MTTNMEKSPLYRIDNDLVKKTKFETFAKKHLQIFLESGKNAQHEYAPLMFAAWLGDFDAVQQLLSQGANVNIETEHGHTALFYAVDASHLKIIERLIQAGANINHQDKENKNTVLFEAVENLRETERLDIIRLLLQSGADPNIHCHWEDTALHQAAWYGEPECIKILLEYNADVNARGIRKETPLMKAGKKECAALLLAAGATINETAKDGWTALMHAASSGNAEVLEFLLQNGANPDVMDSYFKMSAMQWAISHSHIECVKILLKYNASITFNKFKTPLMIACKDGKKEFAVLMLDAGASINETTKYGWTALMNAALYGQTEAVEFLLQNGADPNIPENTKNTALQYAAEEGYTECIKMLLKHNAAVNTKNDEGVTPLMSASRAGETEIIELLIQAGALVNETANDGFTALMHAVNKGNAEAAELLLDKGADQTIKTKKGETALSIAEKKKKKAIAERLRLYQQYGAGSPELKVKKPIKQTAPEKQEAAAKEEPIILEKDFSVIQNADGSCILQKYTGSDSVVIIPDGVTSIGEQAFWRCVNLTSITIPNGVTNIGGGAFYECSSLTSITIPDSVTKISDSAFSDCSDLASVTIPKSVTEIGRQTFRGCKGLTSITIPDSVTNIGEQAFYFCKNLAYVTLPNGIKNLSENIFGGAGLKHIDIPDSVESIDDEAFDHCDLISVTIPGSVKNIGSSAFCATNLVSIYIPKSVTSIGDGAFACYTLENIEVESGNKIYRSENNCLIRIADNALIAVSRNSVIPDSVKSISNEAFFNCSYMTSIILPNSITSIGEGAFRWCVSLENITLPESLTNIGEYAFIDCKKLTSITIPKGVTKINRGVFRRCESLKSVVFLGDIKTIEKYAFMECGNLETIAVQNEVEKIDYDAFAGCDKLTTPVPLKKKDLSSYDIPKLTVCFTGALKKIKRDDAKKLVEELGGQTAPSINKKVNLVVVGADAGSKLEKAYDLEIDMINEHEFLTMLKIKGKLPDTIEIPAEQNGFEFTKEQRATLKDCVEDETLTKKSAKLLEKFVKKNVIPCYNLTIDKGEPTPLDSSIGGIPYCPVGEELPKDENGKEIPLLIQINFDGIELPGYPRKGIFQLFMEGDDDRFDLSAGSRIRYYEDISADYRKDISFSNHLQAGPCGKKIPDDQRHFKIKLEKGWSMYPLGYSNSFEDDVWLFDDCTIYHQLLAEVEAESLSEIFAELFEHERSNIGGYGCTPQGQSCMPYSVAKNKSDAQLLFLAEDIIDWGDCGCIFFGYKDITTMKKDESLWGNGDMA